MKKLFAIVLTALMCLNLAACSSGKAASGSTAASTPASEASSASATKAEHDTFKIGVVQAKIDDESAVISKYYQDYIGPNYNCEFVFSEACTTTDQAMTAIENFADAGCKAIVSFAAVDAEQQALLCQEYGMAYNANGNRTPLTESLFTSNPDNFAGTFGANQAATGKLFGDWIDTLELTADDGFIVCTSIAYKGNLQHQEIASNILKSIQSSCGLTFEQSIEDLVASSSPIEAKNDKGVNVYIYPGTSMEDGWLQGLSAALQTGKYNYLLSAQQIYSVAAVVIDEVEASYNKNIVVGSFGTIGDALKTAFETSDRFGNASIDMATVKPSSVVASIAFAQVYNQLTGYRDIMTAPNGEMAELVFSMWGANSLEDYEAVAGWDKGADTYIASYEIIDSMLGEKTEGLTAEKIQANIDAITFDSVKARLG